MVPFFVINLKRASERWQSVAEAAQNAGVKITRIEGVDGAELPDDKDPIVDREVFGHRTGRSPLAGEIGCYLSHRLALETFLESRSEHGVIMEDDVLITPDSVGRLCAIIEKAGSIDIIKLVNHRSKGFVTSGKTSAGDRIGRTLFGPQGSAAAYIVSRNGAEQFLKQTETMTLPFDVELERGWTRGQDVQSVDQCVFPFSEYREQTSIASRATYRSVKSVWFKRLPTAKFRFSDHLQRFVYACRLPRTSKSN